MPQNQLEKKFVQKVKQNNKNKSQIAAFEKKIRSKETKSYYHSREYVTRSQRKGQEKGKFVQKVKQNNKNKSQIAAFEKKN